jgi:hypothetical protein
MQVSIKLVIYSWSEWKSEDLSFVFGEERLASFVLFALITYNGLFAQIICGFYWIIWLTFIYHSLQFLGMLIFIFNLI